MLSFSRWQRTAAILAVTISLDQLSKWWAVESLTNGRTIDLIPSLQFDLARNSGFSFSTASSRGSLIGVLVLGLSVFLVWQIRRETIEGRAVLFAVILGGAIGNLIDRFFRADDGILSGEVIDFIDVSWYAVFNVADMFVVCGCIAFVGFELANRKSESDTSEPEPDTSEEVST